MRSFSVCCRISSNSPCTSAYFVLLSVSRETIQASPAAIAPLRAAAEPPPGVDLEDARSSRYVRNGSSKYTVPFPENKILRQIQRDHLLSILALEAPDRRVDLSYPCTLGSSSCSA